VHPDSNPEEEGSIPFVCSCFFEPVLSVS